MIPAKYKNSMFPGMDFTSEQNHLRNKSPNDMDFGDFIWFSPYAAKLCIHSFFLFWAIIFGFLLFTFYRQYELIFGAISAVMLGYTIKNYIVIIKRYMKNKKLNLYDIFLKENKIPGDIYNGKNKIN